MILLWLFWQIRISYFKLLTPKPLKWGILGAGTRIFSKDILNYISCVVRILIKQTLVPKKRTLRLVFHDVINLPCHGNFKTSRNSLQKSNDFRGVRFPLYQFFHYSLEIQIFSLNIKSGNSLEIRYSVSCENLLHLHLFFIFFRAIPLCLFNEGSNFITYTTS